MSQGGDRGDCRSGDNDGTSEFDQGCPQVQAHVHATFGTGSEDLRLGAFSIFFLRKKFSAVRSTTIAASWPISFQVGAMAVRKMSAASSNSKPRASHRPRRRRT